MYSVLHGMDLNADDVQAFCRLYTAIVDKAVAMQYEGTYMNKGTGVTERAFHNDLFDRLLSDPALEVGWNAATGPPEGSWTSSTTGSTLN